MPRRLTSMFGTHWYLAFFSTLHIFEVVIRNAIAQALEMLRDGMETLRGLRNRIAHHEPVIAYPLVEHRTRIQRLLKLRCGHTEAWMNQWQIVNTALAARP